MVVVVCNRCTCTPKPFLAVVLLVQSVCSSSVASSAASMAKAGRGRGGGKRPSSRGAAEPEPAASSSDMSVKALASKKLREVFKAFTVEEQDLIVDPLTNLTLRSRLERDISARRNGDFLTHKHHPKM